MISTDELALLYVQKRTLESKLKVLEAFLHLNPTDVEKFNEYIGLKNELQKVDTDLLKHKFKI